MCSWKTTNGQVHLNRTQTIKNHKHQDLHQLCFSAESVQYTVSPAKVTEDNGNLIYFSSVQASRVFLIRNNSLQTLLEKKIAHLD